MFNKKHTDNYKNSLRNNIYKYFNSIKLFNKELCYFNETTISLN